MNGFSSATGSISKIFIKIFKNEILKFPNELDYAIVALKGLFVVYECFKKELNLFFCTCNKKHSNQFNFLKVKQNFTNCFGETKFLIFFWTRPTRVTKIRQEIGLGIRFLR
jgi:hypothetical protein